MPSSKRTAILLISCPDQPGIVSAVSSFIGNHNGNIVYLDQHVDSRAGLFFMRVEWETENLALSNDEFLEYERYGSYYYGTSKKELDRDDFIILDLEVNGATKLLTSNDSYIGIFIDIDDNVLIERLNERGHDDQFIEERMNLAKEQRQSMANFDYIIKNIDLKATIKEILDILYDLEKK